MKTLLKLIIVVIVLNGAYRFGMSEYRFSQLKDSTRSMLVLGTNAPIEQLTEQILKRSSELALPVYENRVTVTREGVRTTATVSYRQDIEVFPGYKYSKDYTFSEEIAAIR